MPRSPEPPGAAAEGSDDDGLLTSEDLFGDLVDAPLSPAPTKPAARRGPVKVRVAEKTGPQAKGISGTADVAAEDMAGLVDAFGPAPQTGPAETPLAPRGAGAPTAPGGAGAPTSSGGAEVDALLDKLSAVEEPPSPELPEPPPADEPGGAEELPPPLETSPPEHEPEEDLGLLLDQLEEEEPEPAMETAVPPEPPPASPTPLPAPLAAAEGEELGHLLDVFSEHRDEPSAAPALGGEQASLAESGPSTGEEAPLLPEEPAPVEEDAAGAEGPSIVEEAPQLLEQPAPVEEGAAEEEDLDEVLSRFIPTAPPPPDAPPSVIALKFQALEPSVEAPKETRTVIDLAALADEALSLPLTRPGVPLVPTEPQTQPSEVSPPDAYGPYRLLERIAAGGMAEVFRAKRSGVEGFEKVVAVKRILPHLSDNKEFVEMFVDEAKMVAGLSHPNIVQIFDLGRIERTYFIAMEYVHGKDLRTILKRAKEKGLRIPLDLSVLIISKVCSALEYAHRKKDESGQPLRIVHRDISPQNILISFEGEVKLTDFGIAKATSKATDTDRGALRGKLLYMSPEQASGHPLDKRSDVFSLGVVFYEMITDVKPFLGTSEKGILQLVRECRFEPARSLNPKISEKLENVVTKALVKDPEERYQDASEMYRDLERVLHERQPPAATELARFMEILFEGGDNPVEGHAAAPEPRVEGGIEIDLDSGEPRLASSSEKEGPPKDPQGFGKLLKRFGIKQR